MVLWGSIVNAFAIVFGALLGSRVKFADSIQRTIMHALSLAILLIGVSMGLETTNILIPIAALVLGGIVGEKINIEGKIAQLARQMQEKTTKRSTTSDSPDLVQGFLTATLVYCVGAMAIIGALNSGLNLDHQVLYAKSMLDGITAIFFAASFGKGVAFSAISVFLYQGGIAFLARFIAPILNQVVIQEITATGGIIIIGIGLNMLDLTRISVGNMLPSVIFAVILALIF